MLDLPREVSRSCSDGKDGRLVFLGLNNADLIMLAVSLSGLVVGPCLILPLFGPAIMGLIGLIEGIIYLTKSQDDFYQTYAVEKKDWF